MINLETLTNRFIDGGSEFPFTCTYASANSFTFVGADYSTKLLRGTLVEVTNGGAKYGYVTSCTYSGGTNTVNLSTINDISRNITTLSASAITGVYFSNLTRLRQHPQYLKYLASPRASSGTFTTITDSSYYMCVGSTVFLSNVFGITSIGTASGSVIFSIPLNLFLNFGVQSFGREDATTGKMLQGILISGTEIRTFDYNNGVTIGANWRLSLNTSYFS